MRATQRRGPSERGHSMVEVLVTVGLLVMVTAIVYGVIIQTQKVTRTGAAASFSQTQMVDAVSRVSRDVATSRRIITATSTSMSAESLSAKGCRLTEYVIADGDGDGAADDLISRTNNIVASDTDSDGKYSVTEREAACPPSWPATLNGVAGTTKSMVIKGLKDATLPSTVIFKYFDQIDNVMSAPVADTGQIGRVQVDVAANVTGRGAPVRLTTSVAPRTGMAPSSGVIGGPPPPGTITDITDSYSCAASQSVTWSRPPGATGYRVTVNGTTAANIADPSTTSYAVSVAPGQTVNVQVFAQGTGGESGAASSVVVRCPAAPSLTGTTLAKDADGFVNDNRLNWNAVSGATNYVIYRAGVSVATVPSATLTWDDPNKAWGSSTAYYIVATNQGGPSANSNTVTRIIAPAAPNLTGSHLNGDRTLNWAAPTSAAPIVKYTLQRKFTGNLMWATVYTGTARAFTDVAAIDADTFDYRVQADNTNSNGGGLSQWDTLSLMPRPVAPAIAGVANDGPYNDITWASVANATAYDIYRDGTLLANLGDVTSYRDSAISWASVKQYTVIASNKTGESPSSNTITLNQMPGPFSITAANARQWGHYKDEKDVMWKDQDGGMYADWSASSGVSDYDVTFDGVNYAMSGTASRYPASGYTVAAPGNVYTIKVVAKAANGRTRTAATKDVMVPPAPPKIAWGGTYCKSAYNANGWKFGAQWNGNPYTGWATRTEITETKFRLADTSAGHAGGYDYFTTRAPIVYSMTNTTRETAWGGITDNADLISNNAAEGGGYRMENYKDGVFDFGRNDSFSFSMTGYKMATGPVACPAGTAAWEYNGNTVTFQKWYVAF